MKKITTKKIRIILIILASIAFNHHLMGQTQDTVEHIIYTDMNPDLYYGCGFTTYWGSCYNTTDIDINNDSIMDYQLSYSNTFNQYMDSFDASIYSFGSNEIADTLVDSGLVATKFHRGDSINQNSSWTTGRMILRYYERYNGSDYVFAGLWGITSDNEYLGIRFHKNDSTYYGWIRLSGDYVCDWAYEKSNNYIIVSSQTRIAENQTSAKNFNLFPNPSTGSFCIDIPDSFNKLTPSYLSIVSSNGEYLKKGVLIDNSKPYIVDLKDQSSGIYYCIIYKGNNKYQRTISIIK